MLKALNLGSLFILSIVLTACSGGSNSNQFLKNTSVSVTSQGNDSFANLTTQFDLGQNVSLAQMDVSVLDPKNMAERGTISFNQLPNGIGQITVSINVSLISNANAALGQTLPNGKPLPLVLGAHAGDVLGVPVLEHSRAYIGGDTSKTAFVGAALAINGFDQVMNQISTPSNVFFNQNVSPKIMGVAGIYASPTAFENGIAVFGKYTAGSAVSAKQANLDPNADYEINQLNNITMRRLYKFFKGGKKHTLRFY